MSDTQVRLTWEHSDDEAKFLVLRSETSGRGFREITEPLDSETKVFNDTRLKSGTVYFYKIQAVKEDDLNSELIKSKLTAEEVASTSSVDFSFKPAGDEVPNRYDPALVTRVTTCSAQDLRCDPASAIYVTGSDRSTIEVIDLPPTLSKIVVDAGERFVGDYRVLNCDVMTFEDPRPTRISIELFRLRLFFPSVGGVINGTKRAKNALRPGAKWKKGERPCEVARQYGGLNPSLALSGKATSVRITIFWKDDEDNERALTLPRVDLVYQLWWIDLGGFYALSRLGDEHVVTQPVEGSANVEVLRISGGIDPTTQTGVSSIFFPANYPLWGIFFGIADNSGRSPSYYLGGSYRLLGRQNTAVATFSFGGAAIPVRTYPGIDVTGDPVFLDASSPLLDGEVGYSVKMFFSVSLGFALDRKGAKGPSS